MRCINLANNFATGMPFATVCTVYRTRYDGMPITIHDVAEPRFSLNSICSLNSESETKAIIENGIGKGCSMELS